VGHPLFLIDELQVPLSDATHRIFIEVFDHFNLVLVLLAREIQERQQNVARNEVLTPLV